MSAPNLTLKNVKIEQEIKYPVPAKEPPRASDINSMFEAYQTTSTPETLRSVAPTAKRRDELLDALHERELWLRALAYHLPAEEMTSSRCMGFSVGISSLHDIGWCLSKLDYTI